MRYRRLKNNDMTFGNQQADFYRDQREAVAQAIMTRLRLWLNEWFLDATEGTPYLEAMLGTGKSKTIEPAMRQRILQTEGVLELTSFEIIFDADTRVASIIAGVDTIYGETTLSGAI